MSYSNRISKAIDQKGETVSIEDYSSKTFSDYGDLVTQSTSETTAVKAIFNQYGQSARYQTEGVYNEGDCSFFFKSNQTGLSNDNVIIRADGTRWKITQVYPHYVNGSKVHTECRVVNI